MDTSNYNTVGKVRGLTGVQLLSSGVRFNSVVEDMIRTADQCTGTVKEDWLFSAEVLRRATTQEKSPFPPEHAHTGYTILEMPMCEDCEPYIDAGSAGDRDSFCLVFHKSAEMDTHLQMNRDQMLSIKRDIDRLIADPTYPCRKSKS